MSGSRLIIRAALVAVAMSVGCGDGCGKRDKRNGDKQPDTPQPIKKSDGPKTKHYTAKRNPAISRPRAKLPQYKSIVLDQPGKAPRKAYRYQPAAGARELTVTARVKSRELQQGEWGPRVELPEIRYGLAVDKSTAPEAPKPADQAADKPAGATFNLRGLKAEVGAPTQSDPKLAEHATMLANDFLQRYRQNVERRRPSIPISDRGQVGDLTLPPELRDKPQGEMTRHEVQQILLESLVVLPEQPIGVGAKWRVKTILFRGAAAVTQRASYQVIKATKTGLRLSATIEQIGEHQVIPWANLPANTTAELLVLFWKVTGEIDLAMDSVVPVSADYDVEMRVHSRIIRPSGNSDFFLESTGKVQIASAAKDAAASDTGAKDTGANKDTGAE